VELSFFCCLERRKGGRKEGGREEENEMNEKSYLGTKQSEKRRKRNAFSLLHCKKKRVPLPKLMLSCDLCTHPQITLPKVTFPIQRHRHVLSI